MEEDFAARASDSPSVCVEKKVTVAFYTFSWSDYHWIGPVSVPQHLPFSKFQEFSQKSRSRANPVCFQVTGPPYHEKPWRVSTWIESNKNNRINDSILAVTTPPHPPPPPTHHIFGRFAHKVLHAVQAIVSPHKALREYVFWLALHVPPSPRTRHLEKFPP